jgi:hypothetical protein
MIQLKLTEMNLCPFLLDRISSTIIECSVAGFIDEVDCKACELKQDLLKNKEGK